MSILAQLHDGGIIKLSDLLKLLEPNHPGEVGPAVDRLWLQGFLKGKNLDVYGISPAGLEAFNREMLRDC